MNALIAYYSWAGNTRAVAEMLQWETGGTLFEIRPTQPYPGNYYDCLEQAKQEIFSGTLPELDSLPDNLADCDTIFIGTPNWWSTLASPVSAFLMKVDLSGRTVVPFCTHGGGGQARTAAATAKLCPDSRVLDGFAAYGRNCSRQRVSQWLAEIGLCDKEDSHETNDCGTVCISAAIGLRGGSGNGSAPRIGASGDFGGIAACRAGQPSLQRG